MNGRVQQSVVVTYVCVCTHVSWCMIPGVLYLYYSIWYI